METSTAREPFVSHRLMGTSLVFTRAGKVLVISRRCVGGFHRLGVLQEHSSVKEADDSEEITKPERE